ncbi:THAP9 [Lepeophtheirus salmonis]|uniref:THAP9 n=1 Tax=Lepeophtheirus salmonis TaxID=72036 RepID=A0A7R8D3Q8_LEPSM|nr:THAP9 [Lepeophtheirus salmonis]CAF2967776.1 THAP9 [Lepeophtheirus salmonis]
MVNSCSAVGCKNRGVLTTFQQGITFHRFPKNSELKSEWISALRRKNFTPSAILSPDALRQMLFQNWKLCLLLQTTSLNPSCVHLDHTYAFPTTLSAAKTKCDLLQTLLDQKLASDRSQVRRLKRTKERLLTTQNHLSDALDVIKQGKTIPDENFTALNERFSDVELEIVKSMINKNKGKGNKFSPSAMDFAAKLYNLGPKAYEFVAQLLTLPSTKSIRRYNGGIEAFEELKRFCATDDWPIMTLDVISTNEAHQSEEKDNPANECLIVLFVGHKKFWKMAVLSS